MRSTSQFVVFLAIAFSVVGAWQYYLWTRLVRDPAWPEPYARIATIALVMLILAGPITILSARFLSPSVIKALSIVLYTWFGMAFLLTVAFFSADVVRWLARAVAFFAGDTQPRDPERRKVIARGVAGAAGAAATALGAVAIRSAQADVEVREVKVALERLPPALSGLSIVQLTDIHIGPTLGR